ncbi:Wzz/FepE/Etk N-terminal domain-containing protein [Eoetvoesiella caeni]|uniref:Chain length determinant protein (Polysaccharide antigen chain regulator) n=1 Tax=Eoetvoesiella caeni TaxID=645616 RepID=A0A366HGB7_9BURK|nr:Wzz/FepE/Etk N-terminal domain-containing protein [Eoetvoesiella caeni]MCI2807789.1 Wzz/FepE/Etk N-terminal domain-containing protein [Eoetvoesiella caeni]NYT54208.1 LPS O-antigen chain length determinant protein WzzB [Eoetvoesiella caeni]RBP41705.1 chain length determinant protein (polysaccharide antigen chain regulator) [Eoetvoesiella caeni]
MAPDTHHNQPSDEIDLRELCTTLWRSKVLILSITLAATCIAAAYAFLSIPSYETSVRLLPPKVSDLASYNTASQLTGEAISGTVDQGYARPAPPGIQSLTTKVAYDAFLQNLDSDSIKLEFFEKYYLPAYGQDHDDVEKQALWKRLNGILTIQLPKSPNSAATTLSFEGEDPKKIADWANHYVTLAANTTQKDFLQNLSSEVAARNKGITEQIATLRKIAETQRQSRIIHVEAALSIAQSIGLDVPPSGSTLIAINNTTTNEVNAFPAGDMMYLRGTKALSSELALLKSRKNEDAYIPELDNLLKKRNLLSSIDLSPAHLSVVTIDRAAIAPQKPLNPKKSLILTLGLILGGVIGIMSALIRNTFKRQPNG